MTLNIVVLISGNGSNLQAIIDAIDAGKIDAKISAVISNQEDAYGLERAKKAGIETAMLLNNQFQNNTSNPSDLSKLQNREAYDRALLQLLKKHHPDLIVLAGFMRILTPELVEQYPGRMINIHPALLPKYRGLHTHDRVLAAGDRKHGTSVHFVTAELDGGPLIAQSILDILPNETPESLKSRIQKLEHELYPKVIGWISEGRVELWDNRVMFDSQPLLP